MSNNETEKQQETMKYNMRSPLPELEINPSYAPIQVGYFSLKK
jgi:hypothetical protein